MHLWKIYKSDHEGYLWVVTKEIDMFEVLDVLKENDYFNPRLVEYIREVLS